MLDPLAPPEGSRSGHGWTQRPPTMAVVLKPDHVRDVDLFVNRYGARAFGPWLFWALERMQGNQGAARVFIEAGHAQSIRFKEETVH